MEASRPTNQQSYIESMQRDYLVQSVPRPIQLASFLSQLHWVRMKAVSSFWHSDTAWHEIHTSLSRFLASVWGSRITFGYLVTSSAGQVNVHLGSAFREQTKTAQRPSLLLHQFGGFFPGSESESVRGCPHLCTEHMGVVSGIPFVVDPKDAVQRETPLNWIERMMRGCRQWGYAVLASPRSAQYCLQMLREAAQRQREITLGANRTVQWADGLIATPSGGLGEELATVVQQHRERCRVATSTGMWQVQAVFFADTEANRCRLGAALLGALGGTKPQPQPLRVHYAQPDGDTGIQHYGTDLTSAELACLATLPAVEVPGFRIKPYAQFDIVPEPAAPPCIAIGRIVDANLPQSVEMSIVEESAVGGGCAPFYEFGVSRDELAKHALICGVTGSGKTNTCFTLLDGLRATPKAVPFLVIEPAKTEYRALSGESRSVRVYTLGEERTAPFRLNPFWFDTSHGKHSTHIQTHIDHLKAVFNAAFVLYAPMPYVLAMCLHEIYQDKGWNLTSSTNTRVSPGESVPSEAFPTLGDLHAKVGRVVDRLGYERRVSMDVRAALETRIGSLCLGAKGLMLNTCASVGLEELLSQPTVIEMEHIGNDEEKAFLIGLLLANLYAYRRAQARAAAEQGTSLSNLQHVTLLEEAHRLLAQAPLEQGNEVANIRGHAVATFANLIAEMRAFGEGIVIVEQIPTKLAADVIKNANLKIMHCLPPRDDRDVVGGAMVMTEEQNRFAATLRQGYAAVFCQGQDGALFVKVDKSPYTDLKGQVPDSEIKAPALGLPTPLCIGLCGIAQREHRCEPLIRDLVARGLPESVWQAFAGLVVGSIASSNWVTIGITRLNQQLAHAFMEGRSGNESLWNCAMVHLAHEWFTAVGDDRKWPFAQVQDIAHRFCNLLCGTELGQPEWQDWRTRLYALLHLDAGPYPGCRHCAETDRCVYRESVRRIGLVPPNLDLLLDALHEERRQGSVRAWQRVGEVCGQVGREVCDASPDLASRLAVCFAVQAGAWYGFGTGQQECLVEYVARNGSNTLSMESQSRSRGAW